MICTDKMVRILIGEAAKILGVSKRTLMRWDKAGRPTSDRDPRTKFRLYDLQEVKIVAHLRKLPAIQAKIQRYAATTPLNPFAPIKPESPNKQEEIKKAFKNRRDWEKELWRLRKQE